MGHCYDRRTGALCCDKCGASGGVRKRTCTATVLTDSARGPRARLRYCIPPALCAACLQEVGGNAALHKDCKDRAAQSQAEYDDIERQLAAGESVAAAAWGSWHANVPEGQVGVLYRSRTATRYVLMAAADYDRSPRPVLSAVATTPWCGPDANEPQF